MDSRQRIRIEYIDIMKGIAIILVVLGHEIDYYNELYEIPLFLQNIKTNINTVHMPVFFFCAGIFADKAVHRSFSHNVIKKTYRLMVPYFLWIFFLTLANAIFAPILGTTANWQRLIESPIKPFGQFWFLYVLFIIEIIYCGFIILIRNNVHRHIIFLLISLVTSYFHLVHQPFELNNIEYYMLFFSTGILFGTYCINIDIVKKYFILIISLIILAIANIIPTTNAIEDSICGLIGIACVMLVALLIRNIRFVGDGLSWIGKRTLEIYLLHPFINIFVRFFTKKIVLNRGVGIVIIINTILIMLVVLILCRIIPYRWKVVRIVFGKD